MLDGFVDAVVQKFENCRPGLGEETIRKGEAAVAEFFLELYEKELPRLRETIQQEEPHLTEAARAEYFGQVDGLVRKVVVPAYARLTGGFTPRERNGFYFLKETLHGLERGLFTGGGILLGAFVVWAPFIPLWEKEWILPFAATGLFIPEIRRALSVRRYERELNALVARTEQEISRIDTAYLTDGEAVTERAARTAADNARTNAQRQRQGQEG